ncbi:MAG: hypothetical protein CGU28_03085 [Candidatus Dactylopiibacterium carminicum]|nr:MAG: hypothetical protein CGU28_03085 [Candidatus Dactylopiibacterium carminicum]
MGSSKKQTVGYWYRPMFHHGLCEAPIDAFLEFRCGDKTAWSGALTQSGRISVNAPDLFGGESDQGGIVGELDVMFGEVDQQPNDYLLSALGEQVPAWRGLATVVWRGGRYGAMSSYPAAASYKLRRAVKGWADDTCWYESRAAIAMRLGAKVALYFAIDLSGSMAGTRLTNMKTALIAVLDQLGDSIDGTSLDIMFSGFGTAQTIMRRDCTADDIADLQAWISARTASGGTNFAVGTQGMPAFYAGVSSTSAQKLAFFITDGEPDAPQEATALAARAYVDQVSGLLCYGINIDLTNTTYTAMVHNVDDVDVAVVSGGDPSAMVGVIRGVLYSGLAAMNLAHVLYQACTDPGMGREPAESMDDASWRTAADWFYANGFGICTSRSPAQESLATFRERIQKVGNCSVQRSAIDGKLRLNIANGEYDLESLPVITDDDILEFSKQPTTLVSAVNSLAVKYYDPDQKRNITTSPMQAPELIDAFGLIHQVVEYPEIPTAELALRVTERDLRAKMSPLQAFDLKVMPGAAYALEPNAYVRLQSPKRRIADMVCIVSGKQEGNLKSGAIALQLTQDVYSLPQTTVLEVETGVDTSPQAPTAIVDQRVFEAPYINVCATLPRAELSVLPADVGYALAVASDPTRNFGYVMAVSSGGPPFAEVDREEWCPTATVVEAAGYMNTVFTLAAGKLLDKVTVGAAVLWDGEIGRVDAIDVAAGTIEIARACADTVPQEHAAGSRLWFWQVAAASDATEYSDGETIDVKLLTNSGSQLLAESAATTQSLTFDQRQVRPYPPANMQVNGEYFPDEVGLRPTTDDILITYTSRNRVLQADMLVAFTDSAVEPEEGTLYSIRLLARPALTEIYAADNVSDLSHAFSPEFGGDVRLQVWSTRAGLPSYQKLTCDFYLDATPPPIAQVLTWITPGTSPGAVISNGGKTFTSGPNAPANWHKGKANVQHVASSGSWYFEVTVDTVNAGATAIGIAVAGTSTTSSSGSTSNAGDGGRYQYFDSGQKRSNGTYSAYALGFSTGDIIGVSMQVVSGTTRVHFYKNGIDLGEAFSVAGATGSWEPHICSYSNTSLNVCALTFAETLKYPPDGFAPW